MATISSTGNTFVNNDTEAFGECLKLPYYNGKIENWILATNTFFIITNIISCIITLAANSLFLFTYFRTPALRNTHYFFLMLLAITDISVGLISQPLYIARKFMEIYNTHDCVLWTAMRASVYYLSGISFLTLTLVSIERWYAVCRPIKHRSGVTQERMAMVAFIVWAVWFIFPVVRFVVPNSYRAFAVLVGGIILVIFVINTTLYVKIQRSVREGNLKFAAKGEQSKTKGEVNLKKEGRMAKTVAVLLFVMVLTYLPTAVGLTSKALRGVNATYMFIFLPFADTLVLMNSMFNPLFYCYRNANIRQAMKKHVWSRTTLLGNSDSSSRKESTSKV